MLDLVNNPAFPRALVIGLFGATGLTLTAIYSRRGPLIYPVYAAILAALALVLVRNAPLTFAERFAAAVAGFIVASSALYIATGVLAARGRQRLVTEGRLPESALHQGVPLAGHAWRVGLLLTLGSLISAGVAYIAA